ncbi:ABC transporter substrate-binding protein [Desulfothermus sp.]
MKKILFFICLILFSKNVIAKQFTFIPQWLPQAQFAGYYVAYKKGFYKQKGIKINILTGGPQSPAPIYLQRKKADFATMWLATAIQMRAHGIKLINLAQIIKRSALMLVARKDKIKKLEDINEKVVGVWNETFRIPLKAFFKKYNLKVKMFQMSSINLFLRGGVDVTCAMWYNEYHKIIMAGVDPKELTTFFFYKYGFNYPEDGIYTLESTYKKYPEICRNFVKASIEGWVYAFNHEKEAINIVLDFMHKAHVPASRAHQMWMLNKMKEIILPPFGKLSKGDFNYVTSILKEQKLIKVVPKFEQFYIDIQK